MRGNTVVVVEGKTSSHRLLLGGMSMSRTSIVLIVAMLFSSAYAQDNWPRFRGPQAAGVTKDDPRLPERWGRDENVIWQVEVPGWGWSCPVVWGSKVFAKPP